MVLKYDASVKNKITLDSTGSDYAGLLAALTPDRNLYAYFRVDFTADDETKRTKFVFLSWGGENSPRLQKAQMSVHMNSVLDIIREFALKLQTDDKSDLSEERVIAQVKKINY